MFIRLLIHVRDGQHASVNDPRSEEILELEVPDTEQGERDAEWSVTGALAGVIQKFRMRKRRMES